MFENTSKKIKVCSYLYFFGTFINLFYKEVRQFVMLDCPSSLITEMVLNILQGLVVCLVISLIVYGFGKIVEHFEKLNDKHS